MMGMTEKRFEAKTIPADKRADWVVGIWDSGVLLNNFAVVRILNDFAEENEQLKKQINELIKGIQESAKMSADVICKPMNNKRWGDDGND